jgi:prostatic aicd phosphatase
VGERNVSLANMYNVFDYMNVNYIHNAQFRQSVTDQQMVRLLLSPLFAPVVQALDPWQEQARALADYHEQAVFSSPTKDGIGNIAGQTILPVILEAMDKIVSTSDPLVLQYIGACFLLRYCVRIADPLHRCRV